MPALTRKRVNGRRLPIRFRILPGFRAGVHRAVKLLAFNDRMTERRAIARQRVFKAGTIEFGGARVDCTVRNISVAGAALDVTTAVGIPHEVILNILTGEVCHPCRIVWRKEKRIGVAFG